MATGFPVTGDNNYGVARWIVDPIKGQGTHTTVQSAVTTAVGFGVPATIFIRPGTYTENIVIPASAQLTISSMTGDQQQTGSGTVSNVVIKGKVSMTAGFVVFGNIRFETNADFAIEMTGTSLSIMTFDNCYFSMTDNTAISFSNTNVSSGMAFEDCWGSVTAPGITLFSYTGSGSSGMDFKNCTFENTGGSVTPSAHNATGSPVQLSRCSFLIPLSLGAGTTMGIYNSELDMQGNAVAAVNTAGTVNIFETVIFTGVTTSILIQSGGVANVAGSVVTSSATNVISGTGILNYGGNTYPLSSGISVSTENMMVQDGTGISGIVQPVNGGTGVDNGLSTITVGGNASLAGAFTFAGTLTGNTAVTFPTSGTLATVAQIPNAITTINGNTGSIAGSTVTIASGAGAASTGSTLKFTNSGTSSVLAVADALTNIILGTQAGDPSISGTGNSGYGSLAFATLTSGSGNTAIGGGTLPAIATGSYNTALGNAAGTAYILGDSHNISIANAGLTGESNAMRLGTTGSGTQQVNKCFLAGVTTQAITALTSPAPVYIGSNGLMGVATSPPAFFAYQAANITNATGNASVYQMGSTALTILSQNGSGLTTAGVFTAPVTGYYSFGATASVSNLTSLMSDFQVVITASTRDYKGVDLNPYVAQSGTLSTITSSMTCLVRMTAGDTAVAKVIVGGGAGATATVLGSSSPNTYFHGHLIFQG